MGRNKRRERTEQLMDALSRRRMYEMADNAIEQSRFDKLVRRGVIVPERPLEA